MRKLYALLAGLFMSLAGSHINAQTTTPPENDAICHANFEFRDSIVSLTPLKWLVRFQAIPFHSENKPVKEVCWDFGDGTTICINVSTATSLVIQHTYLQQGPYNVCVRIKYFDNCVAEKCKVLTWQNPPPDSCRADFEKLPLQSINNPLRATFKALPWHNYNKRPNRICWDFGDGKDTCIEYSNTNPGPYIVNHTYAAPGNYEVCVKIRYQGGCEARKCKPVRIGKPDSCRADFVKLPLSIVNDPLVTTFKALPWHNNNKKPVRICWDFGDGKDTCINYPVNYTGLYLVHHRYIQPGVYNVCLKIRYQGGCEAGKCRPTQIGPKPDTCRADFQRLPVTAANPLIVGFKAIPEHNNNKKPQKICWDFGDGKDTCINYPANYNGIYGVTHRYQHPGLYEVCVKILYYGGCEARKCKPVQVGRPDTCRADFERLPLNTTSNPLQAIFKALPSHNNDRKPAKICWQFGDGKDTCINYPQNYTGQYLVNHRYDEPGNYEVCVKILYYGGCEARKCKPVQIGREDSCRADFERLPYSTASSPLTQVFKALPWHNNNKKPKKICWSFGDGEDTCINYPANYTGQYLVSHRYNHPGNYEVCVKIEYYGGCDARKCKNITVPPIPVNCSVQLFEITPSINSLVRGFFAVPHSNPERRPVRVCWYFGDGEDTCIVIEPNQPIPNLFIRHTYPGPGVYEACVKVLFQGGCIAVDCKKVIVRNPSNVCGGFMVDSMTAPRSFKFKGFSINNPNDEVISYRWTFGDGTSAFGRDVTHTYAQAGVYEVCLYIKTRLGCETRICKPVRVPGNNTPALVLTPNPVINVLHATFFSTHTETVNIRILNGSGSVVRTYNRNVNVGSNTWNFDLSNLLPGVYSFIVQSPNQLSSAIFIKQ